jgi:hypothetical protein
MQMSSSEIKDMVRILFQESLTKHGYGIKELQQLLEKRVGPMEEVYSFRTISSQSRVGIKNSGSARLNVPLLRKLAELPFFWNTRENRYWTVGEIDALLKGERQCDISKVQVGRKLNYWEILVAAKSLTSNERFRLVKELMFSFDENKIFYEPGEGHEDMVRLPPLAILRLSPLLAKSLEALGYGQDYRAAAASLDLEQGLCEEFASCLKAIVLRQLSCPDGFNETAIKGLAALSCKVVDWGSNLDDLRIIPKETYAGDVEEWLSILSEASLNKKMIH